jgi:hypothetical protein
MDTGSPWLHRTASPTGMDTGSPWLHLTASPRTQAPHGFVSLLNPLAWTQAHHGFISLLHHGHRLPMASSHCFTTDTGSPWLHCTASPTGMDTGSPWLHLTASPMGHGSVICKQQHYLCEDHCRAAAGQDIGRFNCRSTARKSTMITFFRRLVAPASSPRLPPSPYEGW